MADPITNFKLESFKESLLKTISTNLGQNNPVLQQELSKLSSKKVLWIRRLKTRWENRKIPVYTQKDIYKQVAAFRQEQYEEEKLLQARSIEKIHIPNDRNLIIAEGPAFYAFDCGKNDYMSAPLCNSAVDIKLLRSKIIVDSFSKAVNIIQSIMNIIELGEQSGGDEMWFLTAFQIFTRENLPESYSALSTYNTADSLFSELAALVGSTTETMKVRSALSRITRKLNDPIGCALIQIKSCYLTLYKILYPEMQEEKMCDMAERNSIICSQFFMSTACLQEIRAFIQFRKSELCEPSLQDIINQCNFLESKLEKYTFKGSSFLPKNMCNLDQGLTSNIEINQVTVMGPTEQNCTNNLGNMDFDLFDSLNINQNKVHSGQHIVRDKSPASARGREKERKSSRQRGFSSSQGRTCLRCSSANHLARNCTLYNEMCESKCAHCGLAHRSHLCKQNVRNKGVSKAYQQSPRQSPARQQQQQHQHNTSQQQQYQQRKQDMYAQQLQSPRSKQSQSPGRGSINNPDRGQSQNPGAKGGSHNLQRESNQHQGSQKIRQNMNFLGNSVELSEPYEGEYMGAHLFNYEKNENVIH